MKTQCEVLSPSEDHLERCAEHLRSGELVGLPTETVYGLAGNALNESSVRKIFEVKGRPLLDPLIVHFASIERAAEQVTFGPEARALADRFWPGALTLVLPKGPGISDLVTAGLPSVAVRVPGHPLFRDILSRLDFPLAAPSANPFGYVSPTRPEHVRHTLGHRIALILDGGPCLHGVESTIVDLRQPNQPRILRPGPIAAEALGIVNTGGHSPHSDQAPQAAPGLLSQHYSPHTPLVCFPHGKQPANLATDEAVVFNRKPAERNASPGVFWLSEDGQPEEVARNLFALVQRLDALDFPRIHIEQAAEQGIGIAVNDRLRRAAAKRPSDNETTCPPA